MRCLAHSRLGTSVLRYETSHCPTLQSHVGSPLGSEPSFRPVSSNSRIQPPDVQESGHSVECCETSASQEGPLPERGSSASRCAAARQLRAQSDGCCCTHELAIWAATGPSLRGERRIAARKEQYAARGARFLVLARGSSLWHRGQNVGVWQKSPIRETTRITTALGKGPTNVLRPFRGADHMPLRPAVRSRRPPRITHQDRLSVPIVLLICLGNHPAGSLHPVSLPLTAESPGPGNEGHQGPLCDAGRWQASMEL